ncbi:MAG: hypothetical protein AB7F66_17655 [Bacteriovoracia bacterium]
MVDACIRAYLPASAGKHSPAIALFATLTAFTGMRYMAYIEWKADNIRKAGKPAKPAEESKPANAPDPVPMHDFVTQVERAANA